MTSINKLSDIVDNGLCIGCGLCQSITGKDSIEISMSSKGRLEPKELKKISPDIFDKILNVCPGVIVEGLPKEQVDIKAKHDLVWGYYLSLVYCWSTDDKIRFESSTGGLLNGLSLYLLDSKKVKFILHTVTDPERPMRSISKLSYNKDELLNSNSCSRYGPASPLDKFHEALNLNEPFAFVGKPCDISAIRQLSKIDPRVNKLCKYLLTLVCGGSTEFTKSQDFIESFKVKEDELSIFRYRGFGNPGKMYIKQKTEESMIANIILFGVKNLLGEFTLDVKFVRMLLVKVPILQHWIPGEDVLTKVKMKVLMQQRQNFPQLHLDKSCI